MHKYWAVVEGSGDNFGAFVPDVSGAAGAGDTFAKAVESVAQALTIHLQDLHERGLELPPVTPHEQLDLTQYELEEPYQFIELEPAPMNPVSLAIEVELERQNIKRAELGRRLGMARSNVSRLTDPFYWGHSTDLLRKVAAALEVDVQISFTPKEVVKA